MQHLFLPADAPAVHLACRLRQLMRFVHHQNMVFLQERPQFLLTVYCVGQQIIVVADLNHNFRTA